MRLYYEVRTFCVDEGLDEFCTQMCSCANLIAKGQQVDITLKGTLQMQPRLWSPIEEQKHYLGNIWWSASSSWLQSGNTSCNSHSTFQECGLRSITYYPMPGVMSHFHAAWRFSQCGLNGNDVKQGNSQQKTKSEQWAWEARSNSRVLMFTSYAPAVWPSWPRAKIGASCQIK